MEGGTAKPRLDGGAGGAKGPGLRAELGFCLRAGACVCRICGPRLWQDTQPQRHMARLAGCLGRCPCPCRAVPL